MSNKKITNELLGYIGKQILMYGVSYIQNNPEQIKSIALKGLNGVSNLISTLGNSNNKKIVKSSKVGK